MGKKSRTQAEQILMLTNTPDGAAYGLDSGKAVTTKAAREIQSDLFVEPQGRAVSRSLADLAAEGLTHAPRRNHPLRPLASSAT